MLGTISRARLLATLGAALAAVIAVSAIGMHSPQDWLLENVFVAATLIYVVATTPRHPLSNAGYVIVFVFLCLHEIGAHSTYSEVPYDDWSRALVGRSLNGLLGWQRNHYDRFLHFSYGFLITIPVRQQFLQVAPLRGFWSYAVPVTLITFTSVFYEMAEWAAATVFGGDLGVAYLGTQGDAWDAHKDMALATLGAISIMVLSAQVNRRRRCDPAADFAESVRQANAVRSPATR